MGGSQADEVGTALDWRKGPACGGGAGGHLFPKLKLRLSSSSHKAWSTGDANKQGGGRWVRTGPLSHTEELGSLWRQGMPLLHFVPAMQTKLRGPVSLPSS